MKYISKVHVRSLQAVIGELSLLIAWFEEEKEYQEELKKAQDIIIGVAVKVESKLEEEK